MFTEFTIWCLKYLKTVVFKRKVYSLRLVWNSDFYYNLVAFVFMFTVQFIDLFGESGWQRIGIRPRDSIKINKYFQIIVIFICFSIIVRNTRSIDFIK